MLFSTISLALLGCSMETAQQTVALSPRMLGWATAAGDPPPPPVSLTASDGTALRLLSIEVDAVVQDPLASTELRLVFDNPLERALEGKLEVTLPKGAALGRLAVRTGRDWRELVPSPVADPRREEPMLLEGGGHRRWSARIVSLPGGSRPEIALSYAEELTGAEPWRLPLRGLPHLDALDVRVLIEDEGGSTETELSEVDLDPTRDLELWLGKERPARALRAGDLVVARLRPALPEGQLPLVPLTVLFDTSASRALGFPGRAAALAQTLAALGPLPVRVVAFDQTAELVYVGPADAFDPEPVLRRGALGASDLTAALAHVREGERLLWVGDGVVTAGERQPDRLCAALREAGVVRLDALVDRGPRDEGLLRELTGRCLPMPGVLLDDPAPARVRHQLSAPVYSALPVQVPGADWVWPDRLEAIQPGDEVLVYASLPPDQPLSVAIGEVPAETLSPLPAPRALLERATRAHRRGEPAARAGAPASKAFAGLERLDPPICPIEPGEDDPSSSELPLSPWEGRYAEFQALLSTDPDGARALAARWREEDPGSVLALLALGEVLERLERPVEAARAYGSLIDLYPGRPEMRRAAGQRLERLAELGLPLAIDTYRVATQLQPDHPGGHRLLAMALLQAGRPAEAFEALARALQQPYPDGRMLAGLRVLREDLGLAAAAWMRVQPDLRESISGRLEALGGLPAREPDVRFVLSWETESSDADLHLIDRSGEEASFHHRTLRSGGELYEDVTHGFVPECFRIARPQGWPYRLEIHHASRGPLGYGLGTVQVVAHDGRGRLFFEAHPFVVQRDDALVSLGEIKPYPGGPKG